MEDLSVTTAAKMRTKTAIASGVNLMIIHSASLQIRLIESKHCSLQIHLCLLIQVLTAIRRSLSSLLQKLLTENKVPNEPPSAKNIGTHTDTHTDDIRGRKPAYI
jgi:ABC-type enterochelin transport system permease subunit